MDEQNDQVSQRILKLDTLRAMGIDPYGQRFDVHHTTGELKLKYDSVDKEELALNKPVCLVAGRIISTRRFGKAAFSHLQDSTGRIQVYFKKDVMGDSTYALFEQLDLGDVVGISGPLFRTKTGELTIQVGGLTLLSKALRPLPEKWHGLTDVEIRYRQRYLDLISNPAVRKIFIQRSNIIKSFRTFLDAEGFLEVETPMMQSIPGGAAARPFVTHHNALGIDLYLRIAPELYLKRLIVGGMERVYEINRNFRNEGISTIHNPEFTMLEFYMAYADYQDLMTFSERLLCFIAEKTLGKLKVESQGNQLDLTPPWRRISLTKAVLERNQLDPSMADNLEKLRKVAQNLRIELQKEDSAGKILQHLFEKTVEPTLIQPLIFPGFYCGKNPGKIKGRITGESTGPDSPMAKNQFD